MSELKIRMACADDAAGVTEVAIQPTVVWGTLQMPAQTTADWQRRLAGNDPNLHYVLVAELDGKIVGMAGLHGHPRARMRHCADLGIMVHDGYQGQGVGKALMATLVDTADKWLNLVRIELEVYSDNERAIKLYRSFGFEVEGCKRMNAFRDGKYVNSLMMGRIRPGFQG
jgi:putative acetyltransferase